MPQYISQPGIDPVLAQMNAQFAQANQAGLERARLSAGQYMKDFRADAEKAGYSLGEWAKRNEQNVKGALFSLSGRNQNVTEQKYQELVNAPENFEQKEQRLADDLSASAPNQLYGTGPTFRDTTTVTGGQKEIKGTEFTTEEALALAEKEGIGNIFVLGAKMLGMTVAELKKNPEALKLVEDWKSNLATELNFKDYTGKGSQNEELFQLYKSGPITSVDLESAKPVLNVPQGLQQNFDNTLAMLDSGGTSPAHSAEVDKALADPIQKAQIKERVIGMLARGEVDKLSRMQYTGDQFKSLFTEESKVGQYNKPELTPFSFGGQKATPATATTTREQLTEGTQGLLDVKEEYYQQQLQRELSNPEVAAASRAMREADTKEAKDKAQTALWEAQTYGMWDQIKNPPPPTSKLMEIQQELFSDDYKAFIKQYQGKLKDIADAGVNSTEYADYRASIERLIKVGASAGFFVDTKVPTDQEIKTRWKLLSGQGIIPTIQDIAPNMGISSGMTDPDFAGLYN